MLGKKKLAFFPHVARSCWGSHVGEAKNSLFPTLRDHVGKAMFWCPMVRDHRLAVPLRDHVGLSQDRCAARAEWTRSNGRSELEDTKGWLPGK